MELSSPGAWVGCPTGLGSRIILEAELMAWWGGSLFGAPGWSLTGSYMSMAGIGLYSPEGDPGARVQAPVQEVH